MNILLLHSYPRKNGFTAHLTQKFVSGIRDAGANLFERDLTTMNLRPCIGCYRCWVVNKGTCFMDDDMNSLLADVLAADCIVCATPLNAFSVSASAKIFFDRTLPLTQPRFETAANGLVRNSVRFADKWPKKLAVIVVGAFKGHENFDAVRSMLSLYTNAVSMELCGELYRPESFLMPFTLAKPMTIKTIEAAFVRAGYELAAHGAISDETKQKAETPLSPDLSFFRKYSNIFWEHALALGDDYRDTSKLVASVTSDVRILMQEMARSIDTVATARLIATFHFEFTDKNICISLLVNKGICEYYEDKKGNADLSVTTTTDIWARAFMRQISMRDALVSRQVVLAGNKALFSRLDRFFPPPVM